MLLPLLALAVGTFIIFQALLSSFIEVTDETVGQIQPNNNIRQQMLEARNTLDDYVLSGEPAARRQLLEESRALDRAFKVFLGARFSHPQEEVAARSARDEWNLAKREILLFSRGRHRGMEPGARLSMDRIDLHLNRGTAKLREANEVDVKEIRGELLAAKAGRTRNLALIGTALLVGVMVAGAAGTITARSILRPLGVLGEGVQRLGSGQLSYRIPALGEDEVGRLAEAFNGMAQRLEIDQAALQELATHDGLTGLYNAREFYRRLGEEISRSARYGLSMGLLMIDIDRFKAVNDDFGHRAGDKVLVKVSGLIAGAIRPIDKVARYGGEEFVVILPQTAGADVLAAAERIRQTVAGETYPVGEDRTIKLTISVGAAAYPGDSRSEEELIRRSDEALYAAKRAGRNTVRRWQKGGEKAA